LTQLERVKAYLSTHQWYTLAEIEAYTGYPQASISAQMRHLRKPKFGAYTIEKRRRTSGHGGTWEYKLCTREAQP
jgi:DNA-binding transcriptional regulator GbsR (MarR family)